MNKKRLAKAVAQTIGVFATVIGGIWILHIVGGAEGVIYACLGGIFLIMFAMICASFHDSDKG